MTIWQGQMRRSRLLASTSSLVRRVLGHSSIETTTRAYAGTETAAAMRHYDKTVERLRRQPAPARGKR